MREKELYEKIEIGKSYDFWTFAGYGSLITIMEDDRYVERKKREAISKGWVWFLYKDDKAAHPLHRRLTIVEKGC